MVLGETCERVVPPSRGRNLKVENCCSKGRVLTLEKCTNPCEFLIPSTTNTTQGFPWEVSLVSRTPVGLFPSLEAIYRFFFSVFTERVKEKVCLPWPHWYYRKMIQTDGIPRNQLDLHRDCSRRLLDSSKSEPTVCSEPASIPKLLSTKKPLAEVQKGPLHPTILLGDPFTSLQSRSHSLSQLMVWLPVSPRRWKPPGELLSIGFPVCRQALSFLLRSGDCTGEVSL